MTEVLSRLLAKPRAAADSYTAPDGLLGSTKPREYTLPLVVGEPGPCGCGCALTPQTSLGFAFETFCRDTVGQPLDPWQRWLAIHALEELPDGRPRFRQLIVLVARQNGKTEFLVLLSLWWMYVLDVGIILGTSTQLKYARESWAKVVKLARRVAWLHAEIARVRESNGEQEIAVWNPERTDVGSRYLIAAANSEGGRSLTIGRLVEDELRQHFDYSAHDAAENAMNADTMGQAWAISNAGTERSIVLNDFTASALKFIATGDGDVRLGYFGWTAPEDCDITDPVAQASANPNLGRPPWGRVDPDALMSKARRAKLNGGEQEDSFRTECLCIRIRDRSDVDEDRIPAEAWLDCTDHESKIVGSVVFAVDMPPAGDRVSIAVAGRRADGLAHIGIIDYRPGTDWAPKRLAELVEKWEPAVVMWQPNAPIGALDQLFKDAHVRLTGMSSTEMADACGALKDDVVNGRLRHVGAAVLDDAFNSAERRVGVEGSWVWGRRKSAGDISPLVAATEALFGLARWGDGEPGAWEV